jgi:8-oxo-dGTP pyrophosphatase MutT (NUDIX family)
MGHVGSEISPLRLLEKRAGGFDLRTIDGLIGLYATDAIRAIFPNVNTVRAGVVLMCGDMVLLVKQRAVGCPRVLSGGRTYMTYNSFWGFPKGLVDCLTYETDTDLLNAALRELAEETGIIPKGIINPTPIIIERDRKVRELMIYFRITVDEFPCIDIDQHEIVDSKWVSIKELHTVRPVSNPTRKIFSWLRSYYE